MQMQLPQLVALLQGPHLLGRGMLLLSCLVGVSHRLPRSRGRAGMRRRPAWGVQPLVVLQPPRHLTLLERRRLEEETLQRQRLATLLLMPP